MIGSPMAEHGRTEAIETDECGDGGTKPSGLERLSSLRSVIAVAAAVVVALGSLAGWLGYRTYETRQAQAQAQAQAQNPLLSSCHDDK